MDSDVAFAPMDEVQADLRSYYEAEARRGLRKPLRGRRVELRESFLDLLEKEDRHSVLDLGAGPGGDGQAFIDAGHQFVGLDLAHGNGRLAAEVGVTVVQGSISAPPFRSGCFDAGWSMSTLMHISEDEVVATLAAMAAPLRAGAPMMITMWGGERRDVVHSHDIEGERRLFSLRPVEQNRDLLATVGAIEQVSTWEVGLDDQHYQLFLVRLP